LAEIGIITNYDKFSDEASLGCRLEGAADKTTLSGIDGFNPKVMLALSYFLVQKMELQILVVGSFSIVDG
jgi:hypothetical protein